MSAEHIAIVRTFYRLVTQRAGALEDHFLGRDRPLGESRVLYEIGPVGADLREVRSRLGLDSGYLSRMVHSLASKGLITVRPGPEDERLRRAELTVAGLAELELMNRRSDEAAIATLVSLTVSQRERLVAAMAEVERLLRAAGAQYERVDPTGPSAQFCLKQFYAELARRFEHGFDPAHTGVMDADDFRPPRGAFVVASVDGEAVACGGVCTAARGIGWIRRMWVAESVRGLGFGRRMLSRLEDEARALGLTTLRLETNRVLTEAIRLYRSAGYVEIDPFNDEAYAHHWFAKHLVDGQSSGLM
jgi:DNA-binding MarR family transcriptional regulator